MGGEGAPENWTIFMDAMCVLLNSQALILAKLPDILIRNDRDVKKLKNDDQVEFYFVNGRST